jgi:hypothetical protein
MRSDLDQTSIRITSFGHVSFPASGNGWGSSSGDKPRITRMEIAGTTLRQKNRGQKNAVAGAIAENASTRIGIRVVGVIPGTVRVWAFVLHPFTR